MPKDRTPAIVSAARTAIGSFGSTRSRTLATDLCVYPEQGLRLGPQDGDDGRKSGSFGQSTHRPGIVKVQTCRVRRLTERTD